MGRSLFEYYNCITIIDASSPLLELLKISSQVMINIEQLENSFIRNFEKKMLIPLHDNLDHYTNTPLEFGKLIADTISLYNSYFRLGRKYFEELKSNLQELRTYSALIEVCVFIFF